MKFVCSVCGYVHEGETPLRQNVRYLPRSRFQKFDAQTGDKDDRTGLLSTL